MPENIIHCPLCGHSTFTLFDVREFLGSRVCNEICNHCGFVFQSPRMTDEELDQFYSNEYRVVYQGDEGPTGKDLFVQNGRAAHAAEFVAAAVDKLDRYLDIGSSAGILLQHFKARFNCSITGVEPGEQYREYAAQTGCAMYASLEALKEADAGRFDLVSLMHVLEHLPDPVQSLTELREQHLHQDGLLLIEVPNLYAHDSFETAHMSAFSPHTLKQTLRMAGFEIILEKTHGVPRSDILPLYLTVLARASQGQAQNIVQPEKLVQFKRKAAMLRRRILQRLRPAAAWLPLPKD